jgi:hypothetical protein
MKPSEYISRALGADSPLSRVLTPRQLVDAGDVIRVSLDFIGRKMDEQYTDMTPDAVSAATALQGFLCAFVEHAMNPALLKNL